ncbi:MAG: ethanolamine ammonia-lyase reactivating factor EutA [Deltaproteobacteria bacterium]|nr:ethanolamine ammonia-lyase reactivating factor EutA [Deltaproteobacteria bacterium]
MEINDIELLSVGVDVGSSTSHLAFSHLLLHRDPDSPTRRFYIKKREVIYEGRIIDTPLLPDDTIDVDALSQFFMAEYEQAGIEPASVQSGAVIVTGESARKENAREIVQALSKGAGHFVAATAGANFESLITAMGSGITARSRAERKTILSCDIGGGTANLAISRNGDVISTSCISVGGRLLAVTSDGTIRRIHSPAEVVMKSLGMDHKVGDHISKIHMEMIAEAFAGALLEALIGPTTSATAKALMVTDDLDFPECIDAYAFSGGVGELLYGMNGQYYDDLGVLLAEKIQELIPNLPAPVVEPKNKIRATVIGAGAYSLSISGSSGFMDDGVTFPIKNVPVIRVDVDESRLSVDHVITETKASFQRFDMKEGEQVVALYFKDPARANYEQLELFARSIEAALSRSIQKQLPIILIFGTDIACGVGNVIRRETKLRTRLLSIDELHLNEGDWIDIGEPLVNGQVFPVTVKSLVFNPN